MNTAHNVRNLVNQRAYFHHLRTSDTGAQLEAIRGIRLCNELLVDEWLAARSEPPEAARTITADNVSYTLAYSANGTHRYLKTADYAGTPKIVKTNIRARLLAELDTVTLLEQEMKLIENWNSDMPERLEVSA